MLAISSTAVHCWTGERSTWSALSKACWTGPLHWGEGVVDFMTVNSQMERLVNNLVATKAVGVSQYQTNPLST